MPVEMMVSHVHITFAYGMEKSVTLWPGFKGLTNNKLVAID